jgi:hypothetical protein
MFFTVFIEIAESLLSVYLAKGFRELFCSSKGFRIDKKVEKHCPRAFSISSTLTPNLTP